MQSGTISVAIGVYFALFILGAVYHLAVDALSKRGYTEGYTWLLVAIGVGVTVAPTGFLIGWGNVGWVYSAFFVTGAWMAFGDIRRHVTKREAMKRELRELSSDERETLAQ